MKCDVLSIEVQTVRLRCYVECTCGEVFTAEAYGTRRPGPSEGGAMFVAGLGDCAGCGTPMTVYQPLALEPIFGAVVN